MSTHRRTINSPHDWYAIPKTSGSWLRPPLNSLKEVLVEEHGSVTLSELRDFDLYLRRPSIETKRMEESESTEERFYRLVNEWKHETARLSSMTALVMHPKYQSIIGMGPAVLPLLFRELRDNPHHWFWALRAITEEDPTQPEDEGNLRMMRESWLDWAKDRGYL